MNSALRTAAWRGAGLLVLAGVLTSAAPAVAGTATFAIVIGTNTSVDKDLEPLRYADDDAARYFDLFRSLGTRTYLLSRLDADTARLHPQASAEAELPRGRELDALVGLLASNVAMARERGLSTVFYFVYAGHGNVDGNKGYITLEDDRLFGDDVLQRVVSRVGADQAHLIVDACYSYFLAYGRGPGGKRRPVEGFAKLTQLGDASEVGLILSTSSAAESHEWEAFQAGVFSHEIRSGLYGAADADGDGVVSYREIAAFVDNANAAIPNERYRPRLHARPPTSGTGALLDLREQQGRMLEIDGSRHGRYLLENHDGVRLVDFHSGPGTGVRLLRPVTGVLYLRQPDEGIEYEVPPSDRPVKLAALTPTTPHVQGRGAAHTAFNKLFERPFNEATVESFHFSKEGEVAEGAIPWGGVVGWTVLAGGGALVLLGVAATGVAATAYFTATPQTSHAEIVQRNQLILASDAAALVLVGLGVAVAAGGASAVLLWPQAEEEP